MSFSENSIMTRSRAIYAKRLTNQNYSEMLNCSSVNEVADYLSTKTQYFDTFGAFTSAKINRMMLESLLKRNFASRFSSLYRFSEIIGNKMCEYFMTVREITAILSCMRYALAQNKFDIFISVPSFEDMSVRFDLMSLANSENISELIIKLKKTPYYEILKDFCDDKPDMVKIENALYGYLDKRACEIAKKSLSKSEYREVLEILAINSDLKLISNVFRMKKFFGTSPEEIIKLNFPTYATLLTKKEIDGMIFAKDADEFLRVVEKTSYGKGFDLQNIDDVMIWARRYKYDKFSKKIMYSTYPNAVMMCCFFLQDNEVKNITSIIEGIKYGIDKDRIKQHLVGVNG